MEQINQQAFLLAMQQMQPVYVKQKQTLNEEETLIGLLYLHYANQGYISLKRALKKQILKEYDNKLQTIYKDLGSNEVNTVKNILKADYQSLYKSLGYYIDHKSLIVPSEIIDKAINTSIDGKLYSDRIWRNKGKLVKWLKTALKNILNGDLTVDEAGKQLKNIFATTTYQSKRLIISELTRAQAQASTNLCQDLGIDSQIWSATFENSCSKCIKLDGKPFKVGEAPNIPLHANCHCVLLPNI